MKILLLIDQQQDSEALWSIFKGKDPAGLENRAKRMGFDTELAKEINRSNSEETKEKVNRLIEDRYRKLLPYMEKSRDLYQESWDEITPEFFETVEKITDYPWFHKEFTCVVSAFHPGISSWGGNQIFRWWKENPYTQRRITAHEMLISYFFSIVRKDFAKANLSDRQIWALGEIAAWALTGLEEDLRRFWPWDERGYYTDHNYPQLVDLQLKLKDPFLDRKSFREYINKGIGAIEQARQNAEG